MSSISNSIVVYFMSILFPFAVFTLCAEFPKSANNFNNSQHSFSPGISNSRSSVLSMRISQCRTKVALRVCQYVSRFPIAVCLYHCLLSGALTTVCANQAMNHLSIAVDLNYYTKTSIQAAEVSGKSEKAGVVKMSSW